MHIASAQATAPTADRTPRVLSFHPHSRIPHSIALTLIAPVEIAEAEAAQRHSARTSLMAALSDAEQWRDFLPATIIDRLIQHHGACWAYNASSVLLSCAGADGTGETEADALREWTLRARYLLTEGAR